MDEVGFVVNFAEEFSPDDTHARLSCALAEGQLTEALHRHWARYVPSVYSAQLCADSGKEERRALRILFHPLDRLLCGGARDPSAVLRGLRETDRPAQQCGRVFKNGEPTYSCRDCSNDPTCVLCIECFQNSIHKNHRYKINTSGGGGYCDCGDSEAWKAGVFCELHQPKPEQQGTQDAVGLLPPEIRETASQLFAITVKYAADLLTWTDCERLPDGLAPEHRSNTYVTMLFNDEVHTYEQVIETLKRAIDCTHKEAIDFATTVDREGRCSVRNDTVVNCGKALTIIEKQTSRLDSSPLVVHVMHSSIVSHQQFALRILTWLHDLISQSDGLRQLFCEMSMKAAPGEEKAIVERMMLADTKLWKSARTQSHQLFMAGILKDQECKKQFAVLFCKIYPAMMAAFTKDDHNYLVCVVGESVQLFTTPTLHYQCLMRDFIADDHLRVVSATSGSVQIFTVPTLARMLVTEHNLLQVILDTFLDECKQKLNPEGRFVFERQERSHAFRRAQYMLCDLRYVLTCRPTASEWNEQLRTNFLNGFSSMLKLLRSMQGMDAVTRQTGQHIEFEPEWEGAFNLQLKLADNVAILQEWCGTDKMVLLDAFITTLNTLANCKDSGVEMDKCTVGEWTANCIKYDVGLQAVSIHVPVTRLLAGLCPHLSLLGITFADTHQAEWVVRGDPQLKITDPWQRIDPVDLIEPSLKTQVLIAQTQAGMWRRNGYSLLNQIYFYHNVRCRTEMYDKDIVILQAGAAMLDSNEFIIHLLNKFALLNWAKEGYHAPREGTRDESTKHTITLAEEFLNLLIIIIGERYTPGLSAVAHDDTIKRELIHQLCMQPMAHSELVKALPENPIHEAGIDDVVQQVAVFKKPVGSAGKGMYELKPEFYDVYNPYFYHYTRAEQSKSEEAQRKRKKLQGQDLALPPPVPPTFCAHFTPIINLLRSDVMLHLIRNTLARTSAKWPKSWSETQFEKALHLIGLGLHEEKRALDAGGAPFGFVTRATHEDYHILSLLQSLVGHYNVTHEAQKDLLLWVIKLFSEVQQRLTGASGESSAAAGASSLVTVDCGLTRDKLAAEREKKAVLAAKRRARIMAKMAKMQRDFILENAEMFEGTTSELQPASSDMDISSACDSQPMEYTPGTGTPIAIGPSQSGTGALGAIRQTCILCQEEQDITHNDRAMVLACFIQKSMVLSRAGSDRVLEDPEQYDPLFMPSDLAVGAHTATCGHTMHAECWQRFFDSILLKERRRTLRFRHHVSYDIEKGEFLCPLCFTLSNSVMPIIPHLNTLGNDVSEKDVELSLKDWVSCIQETVRSSIQEAKDRESQEEAYLFVPCPMSSITKMMAESVAKNFQLLFDYVYDDSSGHFSDSITEMLRKFSTDAYAIGLGVQADDDNIRVPILAWSTCAYTIMVTEQILRDEGKPLFGSLNSRQSDCLSVLVKFAAVCSQEIQPDVVKKHCVTLLSALLCDSADHRLQETPCLADMHLFHYVAELSLSLPTLFAENDANKLSRIPTGGLNDLHLLQVGLAAHVVQVILAAKLDSQHEAMETGVDEEGKALLEIYVRVRSLVGLSVSPLPSPWQLAVYVREAVLPFLRCSALFFHYMTAVHAPEELKEPQSVEDEFSVLLRYLALPTSVSQLLQQGCILQPLVNTWCDAEANKRRRLSRALVAPHPVPYALGVKQLIQLPYDYSELINQVSTFTCPSSDGDDSRAPALCLVCGTMLCSQSYCCQSDLDKTTVGAATAHAYACGAGVGMFLRVRECHVLLLCNRTKGCFVPAPYLDDYGETDQGLRRGNPLHLCSERYRRLQRLWLSHSVPEEIVHLLEANTNLMAIEWQHL